MAERFQRLFTLPSRLYKEGCPVAIIAGALQKDTATGKIFAQIKMRNIGDKDIESCKVLVTAYENSGKEVEGITDFSYLDLIAKPGEDFGSKTAVFLPVESTRSFSVKVIETVFTDKTFIQYDTLGWEQIPEQKSIEEHLKDSELIKQFKLETGEDCNYLPENEKGLFLCSCGEINLDTNLKCNKCGRTYGQLTDILDFADLNNKKDQRINKESLQHKEETYFKAKKLQDENTSASVSEAAALFKEILDYKDARVLANECEKIVPDLKKKEDQKAKKKIIALVASVIIIIGVIAVISIANHNNIEKHFYTGIMPGITNDDEIFEIIESKGYDRDMYLYGYRVGPGNFNYFGGTAHELHCKYYNDGTVSEVSTDGIDISENEARKKLDYLRSRSSSESCDHDDDSGFSYSFSIKDKSYKIEISYYSDGTVYYTIID